MVTSPASGDLLINQLEDLFEAFQKGGAMADSRCGIHVHVDARDLGWSDILRLCKVYALVEPALYILGGEARVANRYAAPSGEKLKVALSSPDPKGSILGVIYKNAPDANYANLAKAKLREEGAVKKDNGRYKGLNLCPWVAGRRISRDLIKPRSKEKYRAENGQYAVRMIGPKFAKANPASDTTVEFRIHENSLDGDRVAEWVKLLTRLIDWVAKATDKDLSELPKSAFRALAKIAPESKDWILLRLLDWRRKTLSNSYQRSAHWQASFRAGPRGMVFSSYRRINFASHCGWVIGGVPPKAVAVPVAPPVVTAPYQQGAATSTVPFNGASQAAVSVSSSGGTAASGASVVRRYSRNEFANNVELYRREARESSAQCDCIDCRVRAAHAAGCSIT